MPRAGVKGLAIGDEVFGVAPGCLGRSVIAAQQLLVPKPPNLTFEDAATTPTAYVTVFQAFGSLNTFSSSTKVDFSPPVFPVHSIVFYPFAVITLIPQK